MRTIRTTIIMLAAILMSGTLAVSAQSTMPKGFSAAQFAQLKKQKVSLAVPLPTWIPDGFRVEKMLIRTGPRVRLENKVFTVVYSRALPGGKQQRFAIDAGFEGIGDLPYEETSSVRSAVGTIYIAYQPPDLDEERKSITDFSMTHWFTVGGTPFHYDGMYGWEPGDTVLSMISLADTRKILQSLKRF